jgi:hypothetical protein
MKITILPRKMRSGICRKIGKPAASRGILTEVSGKRQFPTERLPKQKIVCVSINELDRSRFTDRMSPEFRRISDEIIKSDKKITPSFVVTDKILMEATRKAYKTLGISN